MDMDIEEIKHKITPVLQRHGVRRAAVFGSVARGETSPDSDVDVVVDISRPYGLFEFMDIKRGKLKPYWEKRWTWWSTEASSLELEII